jgi:tetratricopeptide (TPR) repeat protein
MLYFEEVEMPVNRWGAGVKMLAVPLLVFLLLIGAVSCGGGSEERSADTDPVPPAAAVAPGTGRTASPVTIPPGAPAGPARVEGLEAGSDLAVAFQQAAELARTGLYDRALELYEQILEERPEHAPTLINAARIHFIRGRTSEAILLLERSNRAMPNNPRTLAYLGMAEVKAGRFEDALVHLEGSSLLDPTRIDVGNELAGVYFQLERYEDAAEAWERVLKLDSENIMARAGLEQIRQTASSAGSGPPQD